ncbi:MAG: DEAD/DEAH box helicase [Clostridia bacterium]|nr:DEAD/DEAH box helicase [Clostridia bacterium]
MSNKPSFSKNRAAIRRFKRLLKRYNALQNVPDSYQKEIIDAQNRAIEEQMDRRLSSIKADELKKYRTGARIQPISNYSIKQIYNMPVSRLANIKGIGPKSANTIKNCVNTYVSDLRQNERLNLSPDSKSIYTSKLVKSVYQYDKLNQIAEEGRSIKDELPDEKELIKKAKAAAHPVRWAFSEDKETALEHMNDIHRILESSLVTQIDQLEAKRSKALKAAHDEYWKSFSDDPARFHSLIEDCNSKQPQKGKRVEDKSYLDIFDAQLRYQIERVELNTEGLKCVLRPYQTFGVKYILSRGNVLLGDEMGLGKTIEAIAAIVSLRNSGETHFVVVCPASVLINWEREISKHSDLKGYVLHGSNYNENFQSWIENGGVAITNFENTSRFEYDGVIPLTVVDEAHYIKNYNAERTKNTVMILNRSKRRLLMSGTPLENKLEEMVALINLLQPEIVGKIYKLPQPIDQQSFRRVVAPVYFRRTKDAVWKEMPDLQVVEDVLELTQAERNLYSECVMQRTMAAFAKMRQISFLVDNDDDSSKLRRIKEICEQSFENSRKVIVFSFYLDTIERIQSMMGENAFGPITGAISPEKRQQIIDEFSEKDGGAVLMSQIIAGGTGLNIQKASVVIMCEPQYKPSIENQAIARAYRIGQTSNVTVYRLIGEKTVDERILQILKEKQALFDSYADKSDSGEQSIQLNEKELAEQEFNNSAL